MRLGVLVLLAGCDSVFGLSTFADAGPDAPQPPLVQQASAASPGASKLDATLGAAPASTDVLIAIGGAQNGVSMISGGGVTRWQQAAASIVSPTSYIWYGVPDGSSSTVEIATANVGQMWLLVTEWRQLAAGVDAHDAQGLITGASGMIDLSISTNHAPDIVLFAVSCYGAVGTPAGDWTDLQPARAGSLGQHAWYRVATVVGPEAGQAMYTTDWDATLAAFPTAP